MKAAVNALYLILPRALVVGVPLGFYLFHKEIVGTPAIQLPLCSFLDTRSYDSDVLLSYMVL